MTFQKHLDRYAHLLVSYALNIQPGQILTIVTSPLQTELARLITRHAYAKQAKHVEVIFKDPHLEKARIDSGQDLSYVSPVMPALTEEILKQKGAYIRIISNEAPDLFKESDPKKVNEMRLAERAALKRFFEEGVSKAGIQWNVAAAASPGWGKRLFPELSGEEAQKRLWEEIFRICRVDHDNYLDLWHEHGLKLNRRCDKLNALKIKTLHFKGAGTDLKVGLSPKAIFKGGTDKTSSGIAFEPNIPTEECFTTPDYRQTEGRARVTRPVLVNGVLVKGLELEFQQGQITALKASEGKSAFLEYMKSDAKSGYLGEVALVGVDSPIFQSGLIFEEILYDENAACHIAIGMAYKFCLEGSQNLTEEQLESLGCNDSQVHLDMMISDESTDVTAELSDGTSILLIQKGAWVNL
ncbi:MAG: thermophilic metalloprotease family protein [Chlamydiales bacterium]|nr:thermophilic metalloprotease family protein [Chlamydiales bacterium]